MDISEKDDGKEGLVASVKHDCYRGEGGGGVRR